MDTSKSWAYRAAAAPTAVGTRYLSRCRASPNMCRQSCLCYCFPVLLQVWCPSRLRSVVTGGVDGMLTVQLSPRVVDAALLGLQSCKMLAVIWCWNQLLELSTPTQLHVAANVRNTPDYALLCRLYRLWRWLPTPAPQQVTRKASATEVSPHTAKMSAPLALIDASCVAVPSPACSTCRFVSCAFSQRHRICTCLHALHVWLCCCLAYQPWVAGERYGPRCHPCITKRPRLTRSLHPPDAAGRHLLPPHSVLMVRGALSSHTGVS